MKLPNNLSAKLPVKIFAIKLAAITAALLTAITVNAETITFEDLGMSLATDTAYVGRDGAGSFTSAGANFNNNYNAMFGSWNGFAYSKRTSWSSGGFNEFLNDNDTVASPGVGVDGSDTWAVANSFTPNTAVMEAGAGMTFESLYVTNTRTTEFVIEEGNGFSPPFGSTDRFELILNSLDDSGNVLATLDPISLASGPDALDTWQLVNLVGTDLEGANRIGFEFFSTDTGAFGINTPTYVAIDNVSTVAAVPEPGTIALLSILGAAVIAQRKIRSSKAGRPGLE